MRRLIVKTCSVGLALSLAAGGHSAMAQESAPPATVIHPATPGMTAAAPPVYYGLPPQERAEWLAECHRRLGWRMPPRSWHSSRWAREHEIAYAEDVCANYLDSYYAYYAHYARYMQQVAEACQTQRHMKNCPETIEYEAVPVRPAARRIPRRTKIVPTN